MNMLVEGIEMNDKFIKVWVITSAVITLPLMALALFSLYVR